MRLAATCALTLAFTLRGMACESEDERLAWARERMYPSASLEQLRQVRAWLVQATRSCPENGDLWYYRSLVSERLESKPDAFSKKQLEEHPSEAAGKGLNPLTAPPAQKPRLSPYVRGKWALLVGIQDFQDARIPKLQHAANDAMKMRDALVAPTGRFQPDHVKVLTNAQATKTNVLTALGEIRAEAGEDDLVVVYLSSHGLSGESDPTGVSFVVTYDTNIENSATRYATSLPMVELSDFSRLLKAQRFVLVLDTCFGGGAIEPSSKRIVPLDAASNIDSFTGSLHGFTSGVGRAVIAASRSNESSYESKLGNGYFTYYLIQALAQHQGLDNLKTVFADLQSKVSNTVQQELGRSQNPVLDHTENGDEIVLGVDMAKPVAGAQIRTR